MNSANGRKQRGANRQNKQMMAMNQQLISHPPQIPRYEVRHNTRLRFVASSAFFANVTFQNLLDTILVAATSSAGYDAFYAVKVRAVECWSTPVLGTASTVAVIFGGASAGSVGDQSTHTDTSMGIQPAHVRAVPDRRSLAANYQISSNAIAFQLDVPTGSVVDVELSFLDRFLESTACQNALSGATAGTTYLRGLDGLATATSTLPPAITAFQI